MGTSPPLTPHFRRYSAFKHMPTPRYNFLSSYFFFSFAKLFLFHLPQRQLSHQYNALFKFTQPSKCNPLYSGGVSQFFFSLTALVRGKLRDIKFLITIIRWKCQILRFPASILPKKWFIDSGTIIMILHNGPDAKLTIKLLRLLISFVHYNNGFNNLNSADSFQI